MTEKELQLLLNCSNIEEFEVQCALAGIDMKEAVKALSFFKENGKHCIALDHLYWFDENGQKITSPVKVNSLFIYNRNQLTSLEGSPYEIDGTFSCSDCVNLLSLKSAPKKVNNEFFCQYCTSLTSLEGAPQKVENGFFCGGCDSLTTLQGAPEEVGGYFTCSQCKSLTSLEGAPREVYRDFSCDCCSSLTSLKGGPQKVNGTFDCSDCISLTSLEGAPQKIGGDFKCYNCNSLTSLEGAPQKIGRRFYGANNISNKQITAYEDWLKTNPNQPYHDLFAENNVNSMQISEKFVNAITNKNSNLAYHLLQEILKRKYKKRFQFFES